jgi:hypothetical protein
VYFTLYLVRKLKRRRTLTGSAAISTHATAMAMLFPAIAGLIFLTDELTCDRYLGDTGATLSIVPCNSKTSPSGPLLKGADGQHIPSGQALFFAVFASHWAGPILGIDFLRRFKVTVALETSQIFFACTAAAQSAHKSFLPSFDSSVLPLFS